MRLSRFTDISLRALLYLGAAPERVVATREMADRLVVSREHLMKCLRALSDLELVESVQGRAGGYRVSRRRGDMRLGDLVRRLEPSLAMAECFEPDSTCPLTGRCRLAGALASAQAAFLADLDRQTIDDLIAADRPTLVQISPGETDADR